MTKVSPLRFKKASYKKHPCAGALSPVKKYVSFRERQPERRDITAEDVSGAGNSPVEGWNGFVDVS